jgi:hypothetical protein
MTKTPKVEERHQDWILIARDLFHLFATQEGETSWWCVPLKTEIGDRAFLYRPGGYGVVLFLEVIDNVAQNDFLCRTYSMKTARVRVLKKFNPSIPFKAFQGSAELSKQGFVRCNFQGKAFAIAPEIAAAILKLRR